MLNESDNRIIPCGFPLMCSPRLPVFFLALSVVLGGCRVAGEALPVAVDLRADAQLVRAQRLPIVLFFHSTSCPFCREVEESYLKPLLKSNEQTPRFLLRSVEVSQTRPLVTFGGGKTDFRAFARQQGVMLVPHLRFLGPDGEALAPDLVGLTTRDFYGGYLEDSIVAAATKLRGKATP